MVDHLSWLRTFYHLGLRTFYHLGLRTFYHLGLRTFFNRLCLNKFPLCNSFQSLIQSCSAAPRVSFQAYVWFDIGAPAQLLQRLDEGRYPILSFRIVGSERCEYADAPHTLALLRAAR